MEYKITLIEGFGGPGKVIATTSPHPQRMGHSQMASATAGEVWYGSQDRSPLPRDSRMGGR